MRRSIILPTLLIGAAALGIAACGSSNDDSAATSSTGLVSIAQVDGTDVLADSGGKTLYSAAVEKGGRILCVNGCTSFWQPMLATRADATTAATKLDQNLGVVRRPDGGQQLTFDGLPLYTFAEEGSRKLQGDGFTDDFMNTHFEWQAARTGGGSSSSSGTSSGNGY
jgi:predicted lipoprotein with Yx(FWY)xxD motif